MFAFKRVWHLTLFVDICHSFPLSLPSSLLSSLSPYLCLYHCNLFPSISCCSPFNVAFYEHRYFSVSLFPYILIHLPFNVCFFSFFLPLSRFLSLYVCKSISQAFSSSLALPLLCSSLAPQRSATSRRPWTSQKQEEEYLFKESMSLMALGLDIGVIKGEDLTSCRGLFDLMIKSGAHRAVVRILEY